MARVAIEVDKQRLILAIQMAESNGPLRTQNDVWIEAAKLYNTNLPQLGDWKQITHSVAMLRATTWGIELKTLSARGQGRKMSPEHIASMQANRGARVSRKERFAKNDQIKESFIALRKRTPINLHTLVDRVEKGSLKAAIRLMCAQCMGHENVAKEVRNCTSKACPLYAFRPYQKPTDTEESVLVIAGEE